MSSSATVGVVVASRKMATAVAPLCVSPQFHFVESVAGDGEGPALARELDVTPTAGPWAQATTKQAVSAAAAVALT